MGNLKSGLSLVPVSMGNQLFLLFSVEDVDLAFELTEDITHDQKAFLNDSEWGTFLCPQPYRDPAEQLEILHRFSSMQVPPLFLSLLPTSLQSFASYQAGQSLLSCIFSSVSPTADSMAPDIHLHLSPEV